jgi:putative FmdB family regulatory protein
MPIYEYACDHCDEIFEIFHKIDEDCKVACPKCLGPARKLISATNFILKGSGFYVNDYPSKSRKDGAKAEKEGPEKSTGENKPEKSTGENKEEKRAEKKADPK